MAANVDDRLKKSSRIFAEVNGDPRSRDASANNTKPRKNALPYTKYDDIDISGRTNWIFKNIIARGEISNWIDPPGSFKSSLLAEAAVYCGANSEWRGHRNKGPCAVVYFALRRPDLAEPFRAYLRSLNP